MLWLLLGACMSDLPASTISIDEQPWTVRGASVRAIRRSLYEASPRPGAAGVTRTRADVSCRSGLGDAGVADVSVAVRVEVALPSWDRPDDAPAWLGRRWERFVTEVREHEREHARIAASHLSSLDGRMRAAPDCRDALHEAREVVAELEVLQEAWDAQLQGIRF